MNIEDRLTSLESKCDELDKKIDKLINNDLHDLKLRAENTEGWLSRFEWNLNTMWKTLAGGTALLAVVIALCQLLG